MGAQHFKINEKKEILKQVEDAYNKKFGDAWTKTKIVANKKEFWKYEESE